MELGHPCEYILCLKAIAIHSNKFVTVMAALLNYIEAYYIATHCLPSAVAAGTSVTLLKAHLMIDGQSSWLSSKVQKLPWRFYQC